MEPAAALMQLYLQYLLEISSLDPALVPAKDKDMHLENTLDSVLELIFINYPTPPKLFYITFVTFFFQFLVSLIQGGLLWNY